MNISALCMLIFSAAACGREDSQTRVQASYNETTGQLERIADDASGDGRPDRWAYMEGTRLRRVEFDADQDGLIERWEHYDDAMRLARVGFSRKNDGREDAWAIPGPDDHPARIEIASDKTGKIVRREFYSEGRLVSVEEDTHEDGTPDKWESFHDGKLYRVALDTANRGTADRRLTYSDSGALLNFELDEDGDGIFSAAAHDYSRSR
jgi:hypothetical protein